MWQYDIYSNVSHHPRCKAATHFAFCSSQRLAEKQDGQYSNTNYANFKAREEAPGMREQV